MANLLIRDVRIAGRSHTSSSIAIRNGTIVAVTHGSPAASDLSGIENVVNGCHRWVLPGLIDSHCHLCYDYPRRIRSSGEPVIGLVAAANAAAKLAVGVTTVRDLGAMSQRNIALRRDIDRGRIVGPRVIPSGDMISAVGGHMSHYARQASGVSDMRAAVREQARAGAEWIKLMVSGGVATADERWSDLQMNEDEVRAAVDEAHDHGLRVAAHAHPSSAITLAARSGCDTIEHATELDDDAVEAILSNDCAVIPTLAVYSRIMSDTSTPSPIRDQTRDIWERKIPLLRRAYDHGVRIGAGTDSGGSLPSSDYSSELMLLGREVGLPNADVIAAATAGNASILGKPLLGKIEIGAVGDLVILGADPYDDLCALAQVEVVIKAGSVVGIGIADELADNNTGQEGVHP